MPTMANLMATERSGRLLQPPPLRWRNPRQFFSGVAGEDQVADAVVDILARKNPLPENGRFLEAVVKAGPTMKDLKVAEHGGRLLATPLPRRRGAVDVGCDRAVVDNLSATKRLGKRARATDLMTVVQAGPATGDLMTEELDGLVLPPAPMPQLFSGGVVDVGYDHGAAVIDILAAKKPLLENGQLLEAVVQAGPTIKDSTASERGSRLLETPLKRWKNPPPPMPQLFSGGAVDVGYDRAVLNNHSVTKRLPKRGRIMEAVLQPRPTMEEEHRGRVLAPPLPRWRNPPASKRRLFSGDSVDVGYDHAAAVIDVLAAKNPLPANGRFLEAVVQAGPTMKDLTALERCDQLFPPPLPRPRNPPESMPQLFSGGSVDVGYDHATAVVNSLAGKNPLPEKGRFLEAVLQAGPTVKELTAVKHGSHLLPPPLPGRMNGNPPQLFSGSALDVVDYDAAAALIDTRAVGQTLPTMKDMTVADGCLLPPLLPDWMNPPQLFTGNAVDVVDFDAAAALIDTSAAWQTLPTMKDMTVADGCLLPPPLPDWMNPPQFFSGNAVDVVDYDAAAASINILAAGKTLPTMKDTTVAKHDGCLLLPLPPSLTPTPPPPPLPQVQVAGGDRSDEFHV